MAIEVTTKQIQDLRSAFLKDLESKPDTGIHHADVERIKTSDDYIRRFLLHHELDQNLALSMMWDTVQWRRDFKTNDINTNNVRMDYLTDGAFFTHGRDKDGSSLLVFKSKKYVKGQRDLDELKRCLVYWMERLERQEKGKPISTFFDMEGCGLSNMDMEFTKYLINLFKLYYPYYLNYILIYEMPWILNAAFKIIKTWLPEKAVQKIKFVNKKDIKDYVPLDQALTSWGGTDDYVFSFVPEVVENSVSNNTSVSNKKVHFADGSPMSDTAAPFGDRDVDGGVLSVHPPSIITFVKEGNELVSTLELQNTDNQLNISYKMKTTSPEKFRVRPSAGCLTPGARATVSVTLLPGFQLGGLSRDKFLVMSMPVESIELSSQELTELWKNTSGKNISQHRLRCAQIIDAAKNGSAIAVGSPVETEQSQINQLSSQMLKLRDCQTKLQLAVKRTQGLQWITMLLVLVLSFVLMHVLKNEIRDNTSSQVCYKNGDSYTP